jgi:hypothetical protein
MAAVPSFNKVCRMLKERFGQLDRPTTYVAQLRARRRKEKESIPELLQWFNNIGAKAYPSERQATRDRVLLEFFVAAIADDRQRHYVLDDEPETMSDAARTALRWEGIHKTEDLWRRDTPVSGPSDAYRPRRDDQRHVRALNVAEPDELKFEKRLTGVLTSKLEQLTKAVTSEMARMASAVASSVQHVAPSANVEAQRDVMNIAYSPAASTNAASRGLGPCYRCKASGHIARDCTASPKCFTCGGNGHLSHKCAQNGGQSGSGQGQGGSASAARPPRQ